MGKMNKEIKQEEILRPLREKVGVAQMRGVEVDASFMNNPSPALRASSPARGEENSSFNRYAFTLIELLVVVLIIGILAAIALPQYQKAVHNTAIRTHVFPMLTRIYRAEKLYYYTNGTYTQQLDKLDLTVPKGCVLSSYAHSLNYKNHLTCWFGKAKFRFYMSSKNNIASETEYNPVPFDIYFKDQNNSLKEGQIGCRWNGNTKNGTYCSRFGSKLNNQFYLVSPK